MMIQQALIKPGAVRRLALPPRVRFRILRRDGFRCQYCGATAEQTLLEVDHVIPLSKGGTSDEGNLITACVVCNRGKSDIIECVPIDTELPSAGIVAIPNQPNMPDDLDFRILEAIKKGYHRNGIINSLGKPAGTIRRRLQRFIKHGIISPKTVVFHNVNYVKYQIIEESYPVPYLRIG